MVFAYIEVYEASVGVGLADVGVPVTDQVLLQVTKSKERRDRSADSSILF